MTRLGQIGTLALVVAACSKSSPPHGTTTDSSGVRVVENDSRKAQQLERWSVDTQPSIEIGGMAQGPEYVFANIASVQRLSTGEFVILNGAHHPWMLLILCPKGSYFLVIQ